MADTVAELRIGPADAGRRMTLREFRNADFEPGYRYELARGVVVVCILPTYFHMLVLLAIRDALIAYQHENPGRIFAVTGGGESGVDLPIDQTRRHPDVSVYISPPLVPEPQPWENWIPEIAVEVVSESSRARDYDEKPEDYHKSGVKLYWIIDPQTRSATVLTRKGDTWARTSLDEGGTLTSGLLPGFTLKRADVFACLPRD